MISVLDNCEGGQPLLLTALHWREEMTALDAVFMKKLALFHLVFIYA